MKIERLNDYQDAARKTAMGESLDHFVLGLVEEAGEAAGVLKRFHRGDAAYRVLNDYAEKRLSPMARDKLIAEVGDILWYAAMIADLLEVRLEDVATMNIAKLQDRAKRNVIQGEGDNR
jgi:NTP pyrophosphatase (non-canonical NTP hydrolase)